MTRFMYDRIMKKRVHFIGIGGIGMSALAQWYRSEGWSVSGSDAIYGDSGNVIKLKKLGVKVATKPSERPYLPSGVRQVVRNAASPQDSYEREELRRAKKQGAAVLSYSEALGAL